MEVCCNCQVTTAPATPLTGRKELRVFEKEKKFIPNSYDSFSKDKRTINMARLAQFKKEGGINGEDPFDAASKTFQRPSDTP